jgi:tetratricopeptide (TPR) repeat protein
MLRHAVWIGILLVGCGDGTNSQGTPKEASNPQVGEEYFKKYRDEIVRLDKIIAEDPTQAWAYNSRGVEKSELGDFKAAISDFDRCLDLDPKNTAAYSNRGAARFRIGDYKGCIADFEKLIELDPSRKNQAQKWLDDARAKLH